MGISKAPRAVATENVKTGDSEPAIVYQEEIDYCLTRFENGETTFSTWEEIKEELASKRLR